VESINDDEVVFRNYEGKTYRYTQPKIAKDDCGGTSAPEVVSMEIAKKPAARTARRRNSANG
jgi:hypothetical protein